MPVGLLDLRRLLDNMWAASLPGTESPLVRGQVLARETVHRVGSWLKPDHAAIKVRPCRTTRAGNSTAKRCLRHPRQKHIGLGADRIGSRILSNV